MFDKRYWPGDEFVNHLTFTLRHESIDLLILKRAFEAVPKDVLENYVRSIPMGTQTRRTWFFYEMLTQRTLDIEDATNMPAVNALDAKSYFTGKGKISRRHRVRDNLLGNSDWCPIIRRTKRLEAYTKLGLAERAADTINRTSKHLVTRAARFLLLADSQSSFEIEGERALSNRLERWGNAVLQAGMNTLSIDEIIRLHGILFNDSRFVFPGLRPDGVFLGERDHSGNPLPEFIGARQTDIVDLLTGLLSANTRMRENKVDPVLQAAATAFGLVYIHPFQDGNGRMHRCVIHHVLAEREFTPTGMVFPVSTVVLDHINDYRRTLKNHSRPLMEYIEWHSTSEQNVEVLNDTSDLYRYFDCTAEAEFLYTCVKRAIEHDLPKEIEYLRRHDEAMTRITEFIEMPNRLAQDLILFIRQNNGTLSKRKRTKKFNALTNEEVESLERIVQEAFDGFYATGKS